MKLLAHVAEARGLPAVAKKSLSPVWDEESSFLVGDVAEELVVSVLNEDSYFSNDLLGRAKVSLARPWIPTTSRSAPPGTSSSPRATSQEEIPRYCLLLRCKLAAFSFAVLLSLCAA
ncbi:hypothetical protein ABZP36_021986 [Zizania latifolia]